MEHSTRKIHRTKAGSQLLALTEFLPIDWDYVEIVDEKRTDDMIILKVSVLSRVKENFAVPIGISTKTDEVD